VEQAQAAPSGPPGAVGDDTAVRLVGGGGDGLVRSKLVPPPLPKANVPRVRLLRLLDAAVHKRITLVVAPTGYGKSVLVAQWAASHARRRIAFLTVDAGDNDPIRFGRHLQAALDLAETPRTGRPAAAGQRGTPPIVLVLDDVHSISNARLFDGLASYIEDVPSLHLILVSRSDPAFPVHRFRLSDQVVEIRQAELAFDRREARELVHGVSSRDLTDDQVADLLDRTEGWVAGLQLAGLSLRSVDDIDRFVQTFAGDDRHVADYLTEHILQLQDPEMHRFLLWTSVLEEFCVPLCNAVLDDSTGQAMVDRLEREAFVMSSLDDRRTWFRYHLLLRSLLRRHLRAESPELDRTLARRAGEWYLAQGELASGIRYLVEAGEVDRAVEIVLRHGTELFATGRGGEIVRWIEFLPDRVRADNTHVMLFETAARLTRREVLIPGRLLRTLEARSLTDDEAAANDALRAMWHLERGVPAKALVSVNRALRAGASLSSNGSADELGVKAMRNMLVEGSPLVKVIATMQLGRYNEASATLESVFHTSDPFFEVVGLGAASLIDALCGRLTAASRNASRALALADDCGLSQHSVLASPLLALAIVARERGEHDHSARLLESSRTVLSGSPFLGGLIDAEAAELALAAGRLDEALTLVAAHRADRRPLSPAAGTRYRAVEAHLQFLIGGAEHAEAVLNGKADDQSLDIANERMRIAIGTHDLDRAHALLERWPAEPEPRTVLNRGLWAAVVADVAGDERRAVAALSTVLPDVEREGHVGMFLDIGRPVLGPVRAAYNLAPSAFLRRVLEHPVLSGRPSTTRSKGLIEQLTEQELVVLGYLPSRLSNAAIAEELGVSLNTIKTHLKHIYRKFDVSDRGEAITVGERLHLL
jgi:LuxR family maltose regulon positive regulatory protein